MTTDQLKQQNDLTAAECDALLKLILSTPNRITDKYADEFDVNFRKIRHKLGRLADICLLYTSPSPRDPKTSRMPSSA